ncbi:sortase [candidate division WWE3 bacterium]|nr:sortase [candidate division WWE3 bacterium]
MKERMLHLTTGILVSTSIAVGVVLIYFTQINTNSKLLSKTFSSVSVPKLPSIELNLSDFGSKTAQLLGEAGAQLKSSGVKALNALGVSTGGANASKTSTSDADSTEEKPSAFGSKLTPIYEDPVKIYAKKVDNDGKVSEKKLIEAALEKVDVNSAGQMQTPTEWSKAGWYRRSAKAGEEGNIVINGHYDNAQGLPAAFYNLKSLKVNDKVYLVDSFGRTFAYQITETFYVSIFDDDRVERVLKGEGVSLTLVTCGGVWVPAEGTYNNRFVVKAKRI